MESVLATNQTSEKIRLDKTKAYAEVHGRPGIIFQQDGYCFDAGGCQVDPSVGVIINDEKPKPSPRDDTPIRPAYIPPEEPSNTENGIKGMNWKQLKAAVESFGEVYTGKQQAIKFLTGKK